MKKILTEPLVYLTLFVCVFFYKQIFSSQVFYCCDNLLINIPARVFLVKEIFSGRFPLWNPYILSGTPFLADINLGILNPLNLLYAFLSPFRALTISTIVDIFLALSGMYVFLRSLKMSKPGALVSSVIYGFSGTLITYINNFPMLQAAGLAPWVFWAATIYFEKQTVQRYLFFVGVLTLQIISGHPQLTYYTWLSLILYIIFIPELGWQKKLVSFFTAGFLVFLLSAVQTIPFLEFIGLSSRSGLGFPYATFGSLNPLNLGRFILPNSVGDLSGGTAWVQDGSVYGYVGVTAMLFMLFAPFKNRKVKFFGLLGLFSIIAALGKYTPVYYLIYRLLPGAGSFRTPANFLFIYTFSAAILAGFGFEALKNPKITAKMAKVFLCAGSVSLISTLILYIFSLNVQKYFDLLPAKLIIKAGNPQEFRQIIRLVAENALLSTLLIFASTVVFKKRRPLMIAVVFIELFAFSSHGMLSVPLAKADGWLKEGRITGELLKTKDNTRFFVNRSLDQALRIKQFGLSNYSEESAWQARTLRTNLGMLYNLPTIDGYASMIYAPYSAYFSRLPVDPTGIDVREIKNSELSLLGVGRVEEGKNKDIKFTEIETPGPVFLEKNGLRTASGIESQSLSPNRFILRTSTTESADLVVMDTNYPGWEVSVDGKSQVLSSYRSIFQKVSVNPGNHLVEFNFRPKSVTLGLILSLSGLALWLGLAFNEVLNKKKLKGNLKLIKERRASE